MQFITFEFYLFFIAVFAGAILFKGGRFLYGSYLLGISLYFYYLFGVDKLYILLATIVINYLLLQILERTQGKRSAKLVLIIAILVNIGILGYFKYTNFILDTLSEFTGSRLSIEVFAPVGISFYIFRTISHLVDSYRGIIRSGNILDYALYVSFFPQILSGPIMRAEQFYEGLKRKGKMKYQESEIIVLILSGIIKKFVIASYLYDFASAQFATPEAFSSIDLWIGAVAYSCMIYTDFSGYSDMAIALSKLFGFNVQPNFLSPYGAIGLKDFWARWHISLSTWLRDYVYIPLGGSRYGKLRKYFNILITMLISGIWHGAGLTYIVWGALHALGTLVSHIWVDKLSDVKFGWGAKFIGWLITFVYVTLAWIFFNSRTLDSALLYVNGLINSSVTETMFMDWDLFAVMAMVIGFNFIGLRFVRGLEKVIDNIRLPFIILILCIVVYIILRLGPEIVPPFIYFSF